MRKRIKTGCLKTIKDHSRSAEKADCKARLSIGPTLNNVHSQLLKTYFMISHVSRRHWYCRNLKYYFQFWSKLPNSELLIVLQLYTSGSTGKPKWVHILHSCELRSIGCSWSFAWDPAIQASFWMSSLGWRAYVYAIGPLDAQCFVLSHACLTHGVMIILLCSVYTLCNVSVYGLLKRGRSERP